MRKLYDEQMPIADYINLAHGRASTDVDSYYKSLSSPFKTLIDSSASRKYGRLLLLVPLIKSGWSVLDIPLDDEKGPSWLPIIATPMEYVPMTFYKSPKQINRNKRLTKVLGTLSLAERRAIITDASLEYMSSCIYLAEVKSEMASVTSEDDRSHIQIHPCFNANSVISGQIPHIFGHTKRVNELSPTTQGCALATSLSAFVANRGYINDPCSCVFSREDLLSYDLAPNVTISLDKLLDNNLYDHVEGENLFDLSQRAWSQFNDYISSLAATKVKELSNASRSFRLSAVL